MIPLDIIVAVPPQYPLDPVDEAALAREARKGCGMLVVAFVLVAVVVVTLPVSRLMLPEFLGVVLLLLAARAASLRLAGVRVALARKHFRKRRWTQVIALLEPFTDRRGCLTNARFDPGGEAHYLLFKAADAVGDRELATRASLRLVGGRRIKRR